MQKTDMHRMQQNTLNTKANHINSDDIVSSFAVKLNLKQNKPKFPDFESLNLYRVNLKPLKTIRDRLIKTNKKTKKIKRPRSFKIKVITYNTCEDDSDIRTTSKIFQPNAYYYYYNNNHYNQYDHIFKPSSKECSPFQNYKESFEEKEFSNQNDFNPLQFNYSNSSSSNFPNFSIPYQNNYEELYTNPISQTYMMNLNQPPFNSSHTGFESPIMTNPIDNMYPLNFNGYMNNNQYSNPYMNFSHNMNPMSSYNNNYLMNTFDNPQPLLMNSGFQGQIYNQNNMKQNFQSIRELITHLNLLEINNPLDLFVFSKVDIIVKEAQNSKLLQEEIKKRIICNNINIDIYFNYLKPKFIKLCFEQFGNYLIQDLIEISNVFMMREILNIIRTDFMNLAFSPYGSRVLQKLIGFSKTSDMVNEISFLINQNFLDFTKNQNSIFIIVAFVKTFPTKYCRFIYREFNNNCLKIASNQHGCCLLQKCLTISPKNKYEDVLIENLLENLNKLLINSKSNYVIQSILNNKAKFEKFQVTIIDFILNNVDSLSKKKYSANFIEKLLVNDQEFANKLLTTIFKKNLIETMLFNQYGHYIIQKLLKVIPEPYINSLVQKIGALLPKLESTHHGSKLVSKLVSENSKLGSFLDRTSPEEKYNESQQNKSNSTN